MFCEHVPAPKGHLSVCVYVRGRLVEVWDGRNTLVNAERSISARLLGGDVTDRYVGQIGFGTSGVQPAMSNVALQDPYIKSIQSVSYPDATSVLFDFNLTADEANGKNIFEFGLMTQSGVMIARRVRSKALSKTPDITLSGKWRINF